ncbi:MULTISPECIES: YccS family putative transporter [Salinivibrio]|uniref:TIGR01666 family membrane protein n=1 Tax=Salinivibrio kushneri TaxID=1908198 RepID=A0AB36K277_9GAMM|nr:MULTISPECIES: YccS family putative transporter [Salinivibrio]OOE33893.1 TIGR01666 family membrane protein [Salinivibrio kushneri]OOE40835.1 TIGR01666 family membrane protein [Salinivibrio kushneri]OOE42176.1 TIGR01666 family membrane protein [Salinivibrio kushneri]OOE51594.1 TIGR01666 family membrane protein [Salinivibrio kushneri]OOE68485.1 TIGR01666 family membrane protein [Salinivibrio kushneri]
MPFSLPRLPFLPLAVREYWANHRINDSIRVLIALMGVALYAGYAGRTDIVTPLVLGVIASALAEVDDHFWGRLRALGVTLVCFTVAAFSVELLYDTPWLFAIGLTTSSFGFIMLGAIGERYGTIAFASLLLAVYTMLGMEQGSDMWLQPMMLLSGALWYGLLSLAWIMIWPHRPVQHRLAAVFRQTATYMETKSSLFHPVAELVPQPTRIAAANQNAQVVAALNQAKASLLARARRGRLTQRHQTLLQTYFIAQDIHERVSSSHYRYQDLAAHFFHSDILFRFEALLNAQAQACRDVAQAMSIGTHYHHPKTGHQALMAIKQSMAYLSAQEEQDSTRLALLQQLDFLYKNLETVEQQLASLSHLASTDNLQESELADPDAHSLGEMAYRIRRQLTVKSLRFRHAVRLSLSLLTGYALIQGLGLEHGFWILMTIQFVCQTNYSATRSKLKERILGTVAGLLLGVPALYLFPDPSSQLALMVITGVLFFAFRTVQYTLATLFITLLVLMCFSQFGQGFAVILPRLGDTVIGCLIAVAAVRYVLPDWQAHRLRGIMTEALQANRDYLAHVIAQYRVGKRDNLAYRIARRHAHNADAELTTAISNMLVEPGRYRTNIEETFRFLCLNNAMLSYISALGAHRSRMDDEVNHQKMAQLHREIHQSLNTLTERLGQALPTALPAQVPSTGTKTPTGEPVSIDEHHANATIESQSPTYVPVDNAPLSMVLQQLHLIQRMLPELNSLTETLRQQALKQSRT